MTTAAEDVATILEAAGLGTVGVDLFVNFEPSQPHSVITVYCSGGSSPESAVEIEHPNVNIIGHLTTRKIGRRDPVDLDLEAVFAAAGRTGTALEINAYPDRLDLRDEHVLWARRHGVRFAIDTDAHAVGHLDMMRFGVATAQRGWQIGRASCRERV